MTDIMSQGDSNMYDAHAVLFASSSAVLILWGFYAGLVNPLLRSHFPDTWDHGYAHGSRFSTCMFALGTSSVLVLSVLYVSVDSYGVPAGLAPSAYFEAAWRICNYWTNKKLSQDPTNAEVYEFSALLFWYI